VARPEPQRPRRQHEPSGFFAFRTPLLPFEELEAWSAGLRAALGAGQDAGDGAGQAAGRGAGQDAGPGAGQGAGPRADPAEHLAADLAARLAADRELLRRRLRELIARPEIEEALFVASPSLVDGLEIWRTQPDSKKGLRAERALVRYIYRMAARATPFGLFSGCSVAPLAPPVAAGTAGPEPAGSAAAAGAQPAAVRTELAVAPRERYQRHTRLDMDYLFALCEDLGRDAALRAELRFYPNSSLYRAGGRLRYAEARLDDKVRSHHLVAVEATSYLEETLARAQSGALAHDLAAALAAADPEAEITLEEAAEFVTELIDSQVLVSDLSPPVTGPEAIHGLVEQLDAADGSRAAGERLAAARDTLAALDAGGPGAPPARYREIAAALEALPTKVEMARLFQVDMVKPVERAALGAEVMDEIGRALDLVHRLGGRMRQEGLERFRRDFAERYGEGRRVPLCEALDEEIGIGFERSSEVGAEASPLLHGIALSPPGEDPSIPWGRRQAVLLARLGEALAAGRDEIELTAADLDAMVPPETARDPLPDAFQVMATVAAASPEALAAGDFHVLFGGAAGPSGARLLGRFCHADPELTRWVASHLAAEEALRPDALFAEVVHLPQGRIGNILSRPVLRRLEIPYLGRSGAPHEQQIPITDLTVTVAGTRIALHSRRLGKEIVPRLTSAHNFVMRSLGIYRFLCALQTQGVAGGMGWSWGPLDGCPYLPRVRHGRAVLSRACWWLSQDEVKQLGAAKGDARFTAVQELRQRRGLPRLFTLADGDNELLIDLDNVLSIDTFVDVIEDRDRARLHEFFPGPGELLARGPEGRFVHELVIPFVRIPAAATDSDDKPRAGAAPDGSRAGAAPDGSRGSAAPHGSRPGAAPDGSRPSATADKSPARAAPAEPSRPTAAPARPLSPAEPLGDAARAPVRADVDLAGHPRHPLKRSFAPGSAWLYAKLYTGTSTADRALREVVAPLVREAMREGAADHWFFIRYGDPEWHVRLRLHGDPAALAARVVPALHAAAAPLLDDGRLWRLQLDTYEREVERYGGAAGIGLVERLFHVDSEAVLDVLDMLEGDEGAEARWRLALRGIDALFDDLGLDAEARFQALTAMRAGFSQEFGGGAGTPAHKALGVQLDQRFRTERRSLDSLLDPAGDAESPYAPALAVLARRSRELAPIVAELRRLETAGELTSSLAELAPSIIHMHVNRLIRSAQRAHELVLYDFLYQLHRSRAARARPKSS
jgi:thiopeptide-type bacteriocin biosynthesis protein